MGYLLTNKERKIMKNIHFPSNSSVNIQIKSDILRIFDKQLEICWQRDPSDPPANTDIFLFTDLQKVIKKKKMAEPVYIDDSLPHSNFAQDPHFSKDLSADLFLNKEQLNDLLLLTEFSRKSDLLTDLGMIHLQDQMLQSCNLSSWYILDRYRIPLSEHFQFEAEYIKNLKCFSDFPVEIFYGTDHIGFKNNEIEIRIKMNRVIRSSMFDRSGWILDQKRIPLPIHSECSKKEMKQQLTDIVKKVPKYVGKRYLIPAFLFSSFEDQKEDKENDAKKMKMVLRVDEKMDAEGDVSISVFSKPLPSEIRLCTVDLAAVWRKDLKWSIEKEQRFLYEETDTGVLIQRLQFLKSKGER